jgi:site-specific DNA recombinase
MENKRAAIYARVSMANGKQDYERQISDLTSLALSHGFLKENIDVYAEKVSGYQTERFELNKLTDRVTDDAKYYRCVFVTEISRIGRNPIETRKVIDRFTELGVPIYVQSLLQATIDENGKRSLTMNIILQVLIEYANLEAEYIKERSKSGMLASARKGNYHGGVNLPYGYKRDNKKLVIDDEEAQVIRDIFQWYKKGKGAKVISGLLNDKKIPTRMNKSHKGSEINYKRVKRLASNIRWSDKQVLDIISNTIYIGQRKFQGHIVQSPSIIDQDLFDECTVIRSTKRTKNIITAHTFLLKDRIVCGKCGRNYFGRYKPVQGEKVYKCSSTLIKQGSCGNKGINIDFVESMIYNEFISSEKIHTFLTNKTDILRSIKSGLDDNESQISIAQSDIADKHDEKKRLLDFFLKNLITIEIYEERLNQLENEMVALSQKINLLKGQYREKKRALESLESSHADKLVLIKARENREELKVLFSELIHKVVINNVNNDFSLVTIFIAVKGEVQGLTLNILADISGLRRKQSIFQYKVKNMWGYQLFDKYILNEDSHSIKEEIANDYFTNWKVIEDNVTLRMVS